jgi:hypothetical protein
LDRAPFNQWINSICSSVEAALKAAPAIPLCEFDAFDGTGIYALYYVGKHSPVEAYEPTARRNRSGRWAEPIYIGTGTSRRWRANDHSTNRSAYLALRRHARNITLATQHMALDLRDFYFKFVPADPLNAQIAETVMLDRLAPIWNSVIKGFANHHVGTTRYAQKRTRWDVLHMGRPWAAQCQWAPEGTESILHALASHYTHRENVRKQMQLETRNANTAYRKAVQSSKNKDANDE